MSLVSDSPVNSSSSDDFAAFLDDALDSGTSSQSSPEEDDDDDDKDNHNDPEAQLPNDLDTQRIKRRKVAEELENIEELQASTSHSSLEQTLEASKKKDECTHPGSFGEMCILCGQRLQAESGVTFGYIHKGLRLQNDEIVRLRNTDMKNLLRHKKLYLVLDLDHTLLNSTELRDMTSEEEYLKSQTDSLQELQLESLSFGSESVDEVFCAIFECFQFVNGKFRFLTEDVSKGNLFMLNVMHMMTKLRPFARTFLKEASEMFEMYIYTMGDRAYALEMAKLLDPQREYFSSRVISRDDGTQKHQKGLDIVLGQESAVLILDDTEHAWTKHKENLILMERYLFFASSCRQFGFNCKSLSELKSDESDTDGALATVLEVLKQIHKMFFDELKDNLVDRDVRQVLKTVKKEILKGCKIVFSRVFPTKYQAENHHLWKMAEQLGATCATELDSSVTHVVSNDVGTEKSRWAVKHNKFLVLPRWIEAANYMWQKKPEENFSVKPNEEPITPVCSNANS